MKLGKYCKDYFFMVMMFLVFISLTAIIMSVFAMPWQMIVMEILMAVLFLGIAFAWDFGRRKSYYDNLMQNLEGLDQKYLVLETVKRPSFYEGQLYYDLLWESHKSMREQVRKKEKSMLDFKEYIELWVHEVKLPISGLLLMCHNSKQHIDRRFMGQIKKLDNYTDQVLYYARLERAGEDYQFSKANLATIIHNVAMKNKDLLLESGVALRTQAIDRGVVTDTKWMEFVIGQIFSNSIKYRKENEPGVIDVFVTEPEGHKDKELTLHIRDNGIGIVREDLRRVWNKTFTGQNGRKRAKSTGMGLYIVKGLCDKLGNDILIESQEGEYTDVQITFQNCKDKSSHEIQCL